MAPQKIIEKMQAMQAAGETFYSFEFFPPRTDEGKDNLYKKQVKLASYAPLFCDITWGAGGSTADATLDIAESMQNKVGVETMMHLTCTNMPKEKLEEALDKVKAAGVKNILALRGDPPKGQDNFTQVEGGFACALDLVKFIREKYGDYFGIGVAGYPEAHPDVIVEDEEQMKKNYQADLEYLKKKVDAGAEFIVTQLFYDVAKFSQFVQDCRAMGITVPILPGIMPIMTYGGFQRMTGFCKTYVPQDIKDHLESIKDDEAAVKKYGVDLATSMCKTILEAGTPGLHIYTLNQDASAIAILESLGLLSSSTVAEQEPVAATA